MFEITVIIHGLFRTSEENAHYPHDPEEILDMANNFVEPSMFRNFDWEIIDTNTQEVLASWDSSEKKQYVAQAIWDALKGAE